MSLEGPIQSHAKIIREALEDVDETRGFMRRVRMWWWRDDIIATAIDAVKVLELHGKDGANLKKHLGELVKIMGGKADFKGKAANDNNE